MKLRAAVFTLLLAVSCVCMAEDGPGRSGAEFVYISNAGESTLSGFSIDFKSGLLTGISGSPFSTGVGPGALAVSPNGDFLYVAITQQLVGIPSNCIGVAGELIVYGIDKTSGALKQVQDVTLPGSCPSDVALDPSGRFVYVALLTEDGSKNLIAAYSGIPGELAPITGSPFASAHSIARFAIPSRLDVLYASDPQEDTGILLFDRNPQTGALTFRTAESTGVALSSIVVGHNGRFLLGIAPLFAAQANLYEFTIARHGEDEGTLTPTPGSPFSTPTNAAGLDVNRSGTLVAVSQSGGVAVHRRVSFDGNLVLVPGSPFAAGNFPLGITFDPSGNYVYVTNFQDSSVSGFRVTSSTGVLTPISESPFATGSAPSNIVAVRPTNHP